jgi:uncharacterized membrane protein
MSHPHLPTGSSEPHDLDPAYVSLHRRMLVGVVAMVVVAVIGLVALWPAGQPPADGPATDLPTVTGRVLSVEELPSDFGPGNELLRLAVQLSNGPDAGATVMVERASEPTLRFAVGDRVTLANHSSSPETYYLIDFHRLPALSWLAVVFCLSVLAVGRWHGLRALLGLGVSLTVVVTFIVPALMAGSSPPLVALVGSLAIMIVTLYLSHGLSAMTTSAVIGTGASLTLTVGLAYVFIGGAKISGLASHGDSYFPLDGSVDLRGLVLAGLIIAALGVLDDVTISQSSTVYALHSTDPTQTWQQLYTRAMAVGRDHLASVVNTLFLAYAGASLGLLMLFTSSGIPASELLNSELVSTEVVKTVVGSLGLLAAIPLTTLLAALVITQAPPSPTRHEV